ncbi:MAG: MGMT family protein [Oscillospiraceae bacterium]|nr:MGMT family protein [Oscillospiraceae bacterium]
MANKFQLIYQIVRKIPCGKVATYGQIAALTGNPRWARTVGYALHANPYPWGSHFPKELQIPCHRVVNRFGKTAAAFAFGGMDMQRKMLLAEGVSFTAEDCVDLKKHLWDGT